MSHDDRDAFAPYLYTVVTLTMGGQVRFERCVADVFAEGILTLTSTEDGKTVAVLDGWRFVTVFDHNNHPQYWFENANVVEERKAS